MEAALSPNEQPPSRLTVRDDRALASLSLVVLLSSIGTSIANVAVPSLAVAFGASFGEVQWVVLAYLLAATCVIVAVGSLGDRFGQRRLLLWGVLIFTIASALCAVAPTLPALIAARAVQGVGAAIIMALALAMARAAAGDGKVGRAMGVMASTSAVGTALGPVIGGILLDVAGWRAMFVALVPAGAAALLLLRRHFATDRRESRAIPASFDVTGALLLALTLVCYALAMTMGRGSFGAGNVVLLLLSLLGAALFVAVEARASVPLVQLARLRDRVLRTALIANVAVSFVMMSTLVIGPFHLSRVFGFGPAQIGLAMALGPLLVAMLGVPAGHAADRLGGARASLAGLAIIVAGSLAMVGAAADYGIAGYLIPVAVITIGYAMFQASNNMVVMTRVRREESGAMSGMLNLSRNLGLISGASVMAAIFAGAAGTDNLALAAGDAIAAGTRTSFAVAAALAGAVFLLAASRRQRQPAVAAEVRQPAFP